MKAIMSIKKFSMIFCVLLGCVWTTDVLGQAIANFSQSRVDAVTWVENHFQKGKLPPFSFVYGGKHSKDFLRKWQFSEERKVETGVVKITYHWVDKKTRLRVACEVKLYPDNNAVEWVLRLTNDGESPSIKYMSWRAREGK